MEGERLPRVQRKNKLIPSNWKWRSSKKFRKWRKIDKVEENTVIRKKYPNGRIMCSHFNIYETRIFSVRKIIVERSGSYWLWLECCFQTKVFLVILNVFLYGVLRGLLRRRWEVWFTIFFAVRIKRLTTSS